VNENCEAALAESKKFLDSCYTVLCESVWISKEIGPDQVLRSDRVALRFRSRPHPLDDERATCRGVEVADGDEGD